MQDEQVKLIDETEQLSPTGEKRQICLICNKNISNAGLLHENKKYGVNFADVHVVTCSECAEILIKTKKTCPICHRKIDRVISLTCY